MSLNDGVKSGLRTGKYRTEELLLVAALFLVASLIFFLLIPVYAVDVLRADQWYDVRLIQHSSNGTLSLGVLWAQHNQSRMFFQNLITLVLAHTTHFNVLIEDYLSGAMLAAAMMVIIWTHHARAPSTRLLFYCPIPFLMLSVVQWEIVLFGFDICWSLTALALAVTLFLLDRPVLTKYLLGLAITAAVVGSYTSLQGLLIWPAGVALLLQRRRSRHMTAVWIGSAFVTTVVYFVGWSNTNKTSYVLSHPLSAIEFFFATIGDVVGAPITGTPSTTNSLVELLGVVIVALGVWTIATYGVRRDETSGAPIGVALIWFGLVFAVMTTAARAFLGVPWAAASRYTTFDLFILVGCYLALLDRPRTTLMGRKRFGGQLVLRIARALVVSVIALQVVVGAKEAPIAASAYHRLELRSAKVMVNMAKAPDGLVESEVGSGFEPVGFLRQMNSFARTHHLSLFSTGAVATYKREGLPINTTPPATSIVRPVNGARLKGREVLGASAIDAYGVTRVNFEIEGEGRPPTVIDTAVGTPYGWLSSWDTSTVPNGTYTLLSVAYDSTGLMASSAGVVVSVNN